MARGNTQREGRAARSERPGYGEDALRDARLLGYRSIQAMYDDMPSPNTPEQSKEYWDQRERLKKEYSDKVNVVTEMREKEYPAKTEEQYKSLSKGDKSISDGLLDAMKKAQPLNDHITRQGTPQASLEFFPYAGREKFGDAISSFIANLDDSNRQKVYDYMSANNSLPPFITTALDKYVDETRSNYYAQKKDGTNESVMNNYSIEVPIKLPENQPRVKPGTKSSIDGWVITKIKRKEGKESTPAGASDDEVRKNYDAYTTTTYRRFKGAEYPSPP